MESLAEEFFQALSFQYKDGVQVILVYISHKAQKADLQVVTNSMKKMLWSFNYNYKLVIGDFNFHCEESNMLTGFFQDQGLKQIVQEPTQREGRTIDHLYVTTNLVDKIEVNLMFKYFTDHAAMKIKLNV